MNGMSYTKSRFSFSAGPEGKQDCKGQHTAPDIRGKCLRCGQYIRTHGVTEPPESQVAASDIARWRPSDHNG